MSASPSYERMVVSLQDTQFTDAEWAVWEPMVEVVRPRGKTHPHNLRQTIAAIFWRHRNGTGWRTIPTELGPWWRAAQLFIRWAQHGVWERLLNLVQERTGKLALGLAFLGNANERAHAKAAVPPRKMEQALAEVSVRRLIAIAANSASGT